MAVDTIFYNGLFRGYGIAGDVTATAIHKGRFIAFGSDKEILLHKTTSTQLINLHGKLVIPGLNDSHIHLIRGGLSFNMELRWDGILSLADALALLKDQVDRTPPPQWVRVVGGWTEFQFKEKRLPTLAEINALAPETPVFILHLYDCALLNRAALHAIGYDKHTKAPPGTIIERDKAGNPTGMLVANPNAIILYSALSLGPKLATADQINSTQHFMRELNRLGITSVCDAGGGFQRFPDDYAVIEQLATENKLTVRIAYHLFTQRPGDEYADFKFWTQTTHYEQGNSFYHLNGAGEMLVFSAADFEDFLKPRPDLSPEMEQQLEPIVRLLSENRWPFRLHATYDESIQRALSVYEKVNQAFPLKGLHWFFDHAETISPASIDRVKKLGGGIAIQNRMAFQGEYFIDRYGKKATLNTPPIKAILAAGIPVGMGTDATRVSSYNPWLCLYWLTTGKSIGGTKLYDETNILSRELALELYTRGSAWFSNEENKKGSFLPGQFADFAVINQNYFTVADDDIKDLYSVLTVVDGKIVHGSDEFKAFNPPLPPISPDWSPVKFHGTYANNKVILTQHFSSCSHQFANQNPLDCHCFAF